MSSLSKFFQKRHEKNSRQSSNQRNQTLTQMFSTNFLVTQKNSKKATKILQKPQKYEPFQAYDAQYQQQQIADKLRKQKKNKMVPQSQQQQIQQDQEVQPQIQQPIKVNEKKVPKKEKRKKADQKFNQSQLKIQSEDIKTKKKRKTNKSGEQIKQQHEQLHKQKDTEQQKKQKNEEPENLQSTIFVGNVPLDSTHKTMKNSFQKYGKILKVWFRSIPVQQESKIPKKALHILKKYQQGADAMNAYIKFEREQDAIAACQENGKQIQGKNIKVTLCNQFDIDYQSTVFIGNLPKNVKDQELWDAFQDIGQIKGVRVVRNRQTFEGIGIGYVRFQNKELMRKAIQLKNGTTIGDRPMRIKKAVPKQRLQKKFKKIKQKKQMKNKPFSQSTTGKGAKFRQNKDQQNGENISNQHNHMRSDKFPQKKNKPIHKNFQRQNNRINNSNIDSQKIQSKQKPLSKQPQTQVFQRRFRPKQSFQGTRKFLQ